MSEFKLFRLKKWLGHDSSSLALKPIFGQRLIENMVYKAFPKCLICLCLCFTAKLKLKWLYTAVGEGSTDSSVNSLYWRTGMRSSGVLIDPVNVVVYRKRCVSALAWWFKLLVKAGLEYTPHVKGLITQFHSMPYTFLQLLLSDLNKELLPVI